MAVSASCSHSRHLGLVVTVIVSALSPGHPMVRSVSSVVSCVLAVSVDCCLVVWGPGRRNPASARRKLKSSLLLSFVFLALLTRNTSSPQTWQAGHTAALRCQSDWDWWRVTLRAFMGLGYFGRASQRDRRYFSVSPVA